MAARTATAGKLESKPGGCKARADELFEPGANPGKRTPPQDGAALLGDAREEARRFARGIPDRDLEGLGDLFLDRLGRFGRDLLCERADFLGLLVIASICLRANSPFNAT